MLKYTFGGKDISEVLAMPVVEATQFFGSEPGTAETLLADVEQLLALLVDAGKSVLVIEHHQAVMAHADWIIDLGPGAGHEAAGSSSRAHPPTW